MLQDANDKLTLQPDFNPNSKHIQQKWLKGKFCLSTSLSIESVLLFLIKKIHFKNSKNPRGQDFLGSEW